jgi:hypothetical protein
MTHLLHGNPHADNSRFKNKMKEAKTYESLINMYSGKRESKHMDTLSIPIFANSAFPNTKVTASKAV